jgi:hypothetical protein
MNSYFTEISHHFGKLEYSWKKDSMARVEILCQFCAKFTGAFYDARDELWRCDECDHDSGWVGSILDRTALRHKISKCLPYSSDKDWQKVADKCRENDDFSHSFIMEQGSDLV